jgi:hypothetical protein
MDRLSTEQHAETQIARDFADQRGLGESNAAEQALVDLVFGSETRLLAAVRGGEPPIDVLRRDLERFFESSTVAVTGDTLVLLRDAVDHWALHHRLVPVRAEAWHFGNLVEPTGRKTYLLRTEVDLARHVDTAHAVIIATTEEPRRFARFLLRHYVERRPVFLWTAASNLYRVRGTGEGLKFFRTADPGAYDFEVEAGRVSDVASGNDVEPARIKVELLMHEYEPTHAGFGEESVSGFVKIEEERSRVRVRVMVDDAPEDSPAPQDMDIGTSSARLAADAVKEFCEKRAWPPADGSTGPGPFIGEIRYVMQNAQPDALYVFLDGQIFLDAQASPHNASVSATFLKDASARLRRSSSGAQILVLSTPLPKSRTLTDELFCVDLPLPSRNEIIVEMRRLLDKYSLRLPGGDGSAMDELGVSDELSLLTDAAAGMTLQDIAVAMRRASSQGLASVPVLLESIQTGKRAAVKRSPALELIEHLPSPDIVLGGMERLIQWLAIRRRVFEHPERAARFGIERRPKGVLLLGIPGSGKSLAAKVIAREWNLPLVRLDMGAIQNAFVGASEERIREALRIVEAMSPCVLWIDEIDKGIAQGEGTSSHSVDLNIRATLLTWLQESRAPVFCVATANRFSNLPPELTRAGRFDARFFLGCPNAEGRREILAIHLAVRGIHLDTSSTEAAVEAMHGFTGAEIEQAVLDGLYAAFAEDRLATPVDVAKAAERVKPIVRAVGNGLEEVWALIDQGRVELASTEHLTRSDLAKLIDPTLFSPMYCRLQVIGGWEKHAQRAEKLLMGDPLMPRSAVFMGTGDAKWVYAQTNVRYDEKDQFDYKFIDELETIAQNGVLDTLVSELGVESFIFEDDGLLDRLKKEPGFAGYAELFKFAPVRSPA